MKFKPIALTLLDITRTTGNLEEYFAQRSENFYLYLFPPSFVEKESRLIYYKDGSIKWEKKYFWYKGKNKFIKTIFCYFYLLHLLIFVVPKKTIFITYQPLFCAFSSIHRLLKKTTLVFVVGDYFPVRTDPLTKIYHFLTKYYMKHCKYILLPSPMYEEVYKVAKPSWQHRDEFKYAVKKISVKRQPVRNLLGYIGHVRSGQGIEIIFDALSQCVNLNLEMIGHGQVLDEYKKMAEEKGISQRIKFYGFVKDAGKMAEIISRWEIGMAVYDPSPNNLTFYTEPSKVKTYIQYKVPVIMTKITYISRELENTGAGLTVDYNGASIVEAIGKIQDKYTEFENGVQLLQDKYEFFRYYDTHLRFLTEI